MPRVLYLNTVNQGKADALSIFSRKPCKVVLIGEFSGKTEERLMSYLSFAAKVSGRPIIAVDLDSRDFYYEVSESGVVTKSSSGDHWFSVCQAFALREDVGMVCTSDYASSTKTTALGLYPNAGYEVFM